MIEKEKKEFKKLKQENAVPQWELEVAQKVMQTVEDKNTRTERD